MRADMCVCTRAYVHSSYINSTYLHPLLCVSTGSDEQADEVVRGELFLCMQRFEAVRRHQHITNK